MFIEAKVNPGTIRQVDVADENNQRNVIFMAKSTIGFCEYSPNASDVYIAGPEFDITKGVFIKNGSGKWEVKNPGCSGFINYYLSPKMRSVAGEAPKKT